MRVQVIFARPEDPLAHIAALTQAKLAAREPGQAYSTGEPDRLLAGVYTSPPSRGTAPELPVATGVAGTALGKQAAELADRKAMLERVLDAGRAIAAELDPVRAAAAIVEQTCACETVPQSTPVVSRRCSPGPLL
jgi:hypothetical protein